MRYSASKMAFKVIGNGTIWQIVRVPVIAYHSNYKAILYRLRDIGSYSELLVENCKNFIPNLYLASPHGGDPVKVSHNCLMPIQLEWLGYRVAGASTPYKRWSKCTMEKVGGKRFCRNLGGGSALIINALPLSFCENATRRYPTWRS